MSVIIDDIVDFVTNADIVDVKENYAIRTRGIRSSAAGFCFQRDFGTKHIYASYPASPTAITIIDGLNLYTAVNNSYYDIVAGLDTSNNLRFFVYDSSWIELTRKITAVVADASIGADDIAVTIGTVQENGANVALSSNELQYWIVKNVTQGKVTAVALSDAISSGGTGTFTGGQSVAKLGSNGLGYVNGDSLEFYKLTGVYDGYDFTNGATPHIRFHSKEANNKAFVYYGDSSTPPVLNNPFLIERRANKSYFYAESGGTFTPNISAWPGGASGWHIDKGGGGLIPDFTLYSSTPITPASGTVSTDVDDTSGNAWLRIKVSTADQTDAHENWDASFLVTILYDDDTKESDPVFQIFADTSAAFKYPETTWTFLVNFAKMNKRISGLKIYQKGVIGGTPSAFGTTDSDYTEYKQVAHIGISSSTGLSATIEWTPTSSGTDFQAGFSHSLAITITGTVYNLGLDSGKTLDGNLAHAVDKARSYLTPRYAVSASRAQGSVVVVDQSDTILRISTFDGDGVHEEDNFPDLTVDNAGNKQKISLLGRGELMGLGIASDQIAAFRRSEIEFVDLQSGVFRIVRADVAAKRSIIQTKFGLFWCGNSGIWMLENYGSSEPKLINKRWQNWYDGTLKIDDGLTSYITNSYRASAVAGWDEIYQEVWFQVQTNKADSGSEYLSYRYNPLTDKWSIRKLKLHASDELPIRFFAKRDRVSTSSEEAQMIIGYASGLLQYPNKTGSFLYEDAVTSADASQSLGYETSVKVNVGSLYGLEKRSLAKHIILDYDGESKDGVGLFELNLYANGESDAFDAKTYRIDEWPVKRRIAFRGPIEQLEVEVALPTTGTSNFKKLDMSSIEIITDTLERVGNA